jgi:hypothetical protein
MNLVENYRRGLRYLSKRQASLGAVAKQRCSLAKGTPARALMEGVAGKLHVSFQQLKADVEFAQAVGSILENCGDEALAVLFNRDRPQDRGAIMKLSRTADARQQYRIDGVKNGGFRSVAPQGDDSVFDTVAFCEVPSRLARARGVLLKLETLIGCIQEPTVRRECGRLAASCRCAGRLLRKFLKATSVTQSDVGLACSKEKVWPVLMDRTIRGRAVGNARQALRLTIKSVWDYPEMQRRRIIPSQRERERAIVELDQIICSTSAIVAALKVR